MRGYDNLHNDAAWLDISARGKIRVMGEDRARFLHAMSTNHITGLMPETGCYAFFLTAAGRILADANVLCRADSFLLDTEPETRQKLIEHLEKFIIADDVTLEDVTPALATVAVEGPRSHDVLTAAGVPAIGINYGSSVQWGSNLAARLSVTGGPGFFIFAPTVDKREILRQIDAAGAVSGDEEAFRTVRLEFGKPRYGEDISERYLAQETGRTAAMHFQKGCYIGQEIVERTRSRGLIARVLQPLEIEGQKAPGPGTKLQAAGAAAGEITSAAYSPALGRVVALAYLRVQYAEPGTAMMAGGLEARVRVP
ncbi:MAG TPA: glycine cleavage T C-terminal barrel domain-containing protein [Bryobacteraceae bacterium]|nr:glycine cleavage T C-terminal barrel domain-containing protein [Bryobacteraceae bacterium]